MYHKFFTMVLMTLIIKRTRKRHFKIKFVDLNSFCENNSIVGVQGLKMRFDAYGM